MIQEYTVTKMRCNVCFDDLERFKTSAFMASTPETYTYYEKGDIHLCPSCAILILKEQCNVTPVTIEKAKSSTGNARRGYTAV